MSCGFKVSPLSASLSLCLFFPAFFSLCSAWWLYHKSSNYTYFAHTKSHTHIHTPINTSLLGTAKAQNDYRFSVSSAPKLCKPLVYVPVLFWHSYPRQGMGFSSEATVEGYRCGLQKKRKRFWIICSFWQKNWWIVVNNVLRISMFEFCKHSHSHTHKHNQS